MSKSTEAKKYLLENGKLTLKDGTVYKSVLCVHINNSPETRRNIPPYTMTFLIGDKRQLIHFDKIKSFDLTRRINHNKILGERKQYE